jgi:hypothetical protein
MFIWERDLSLPCGIPAFVTGDFNINILKKASITNIKSVFSLWTTMDFNKLSNYPPIEEEAFQIIFILMDLKVHMYWYRIQHYSNLLQWPHAAFYCHS